jgi:hypothetical protein
LFTADSPEKIRFLPKYQRFFFFTTDSDGRKKDIACPVS